MVLLGQRAELAAISAEDVCEELGSVIWCDGLMVLGFCNGTHEEAAYISSRPLLVFFVAGRARDLQSVPGSTFRRSKLRRECICADW